MARILLIDDDANRPDIVVTDTIMPNQEGIETVIKQTRTAPEVAIIAMSGGGRTGNRDFLAMAEKLGAAKVTIRGGSVRDVRLTATAVRDQLVTLDGVELSTERTDGALLSRAAGAGGPRLYD